MDDPGHNTAQNSTLPGVASGTGPTSFRETETVRNELLDQFEQLGHLAERLLRCYRDQIPDPGAAAFAGQLWAAIESTVVSTQELLPFAREVLDECGAELPPDELVRVRRRARHDIRNLIAPVYGVSQEVQLEAPADSPLDRAAAELRRGCEAAIRLLDILTQKIGIHAPAATGNVHQARVVSPPGQVEPSRILVADDHPASADQLRRHLVRQGHSVQVVHDGQQAITALNEQRDFDLALLDVIMPGRDGVQVLSWIKQHNELRHIPVIMISGLADDQRTVNCIAAGAEDYLCKPINTILLDARVGSCLRRRQAEQHRLEQYFSSELARELACDSRDLLRTRNADVSILFCDIRRFCAISERVGAETTIDWISSTMSRLSQIVFEHQGVLVEYTGDGLMAMWGAPQEDQHNHADLAVQAALEMLAALGPLSAAWQGRLQEQFQLGMGINSGPAQVGVIGSSPKFVYGPLGSTVNLARRVEGTTKHLRSSLIVTQHTKRQLRDRKRYATRRLCRARVVNVQRPVSLYEVQSFDHQLVPVFRTYQKALRHYEKRQFPDVVRVLGQLLATGDTLSDVPSQLLLSRALSVMADESNFNPVWEFGK